MADAQFVTTADQQSGQPHTRTYQACIPCRQRKVRCDLGPVDNPHEPPCVRCRRESKECFFSATRRKKRAADSGAFDDTELESLEVKGGRKRLKADSEEFDPPPDRYTSFPLTPGGSNGQNQPLRRPATTTTDSYGTDDDDHEDEQVNTHTAAILQNAEVHSGHDALNVLLEAATHHRTGSTSSTRPTDFKGLSPHGLPSATSPPLMRKAISKPRLQSGHTASPNQLLDPAITGGPTSAGSAADLTCALKAWSRFKFVRSGWFTAREGIEYVNYFYTKLSPLTPIIMPEYNSLARHATLLSEEPMLIVTILTIASRHMKLAGTGSQSRPHAIHQKLWTYLEGMINRVVWGQEQFNGGICGTGSVAGSDVNPFTRKGLRTLGTVESLMLLTEWHPRSMHFPPDDDDSELLLPEDPGRSDKDDEDATDPIKGIGGQRIDTWLEPCWRSDRICWMLLSMAMSLAFEIGVFDENTARHMEADRTVTDEQRRAYETRRLHAKNLLLVYTTMTSGRVGLTSMLPQMYSEPGLSELFTRASVTFTSTKDLVIHLWLRIASIMKTGNQDLFSNRAHTREIIRTGQYQQLLHNLQPMLSSWRHTFESSKDIPVIMRHVLIIEYEYARVYINSLGLQAVVERCTSNIRDQSQGIPPGTQQGPNAIPAAVFEKWYGGDRYYIGEVIDGSRNLLRSVVEGLYPDKRLKHAPVRTYFRIISVAIILLKTFALGATEEDVAISLSYLDRTIEALRTCIVDDVHVASRFADLLDTLTNRIRSRFVRMARTGTNGASRAASRSPIPQAYPLSAPMQTQSSIRSTTPYASYHHQQQQQAQSNAGAQTSSLYRNMTTTNGRDNPLFGISAQTYDFSENGGPFSIMPPPTNPSTPNMHHSSLDNGYGNGYSSSLGGGYGDDSADWLALPLDPILNYGADVTSTGYGPGVGEYDMLELLLNEAQQ